jgi:hypothetical protein
MVARVLDLNMVGVSTSSQARKIPTSALQGERQEYGHLDLHDFRRAFAKLPKEQRKS